MTLAFKTAMVTSRESEADKWRLLETLYNDHYLNGVPSASPRIPKIIHQIWLGSALPPRCAELGETWRRQNPDWEYRLWTGADVRQLNLRNREAYERAKNWGAKSDILRYELLYQYGGLYADTDFECLKPFDPLHHLCDFYSSVFSPDSCVFPNGLLASSPRNEIIQRCIEELKHISDGATEEQIMQATGPYHLTRCVFDMLPRVSQKVVIFPSVFFYPLPSECRFETLEKQRDFIMPESFAIHYWHVSWKSSPTWRRKMYQKTKEAIRKILLD
ncbi:MAG: glycosyltransferase [Candidatus Sumerlaeota bacterium]|nr:glycosyltransferase [Candidatus Sumerlaeota bacterium]